MLVIFHVVVTTCVKAVLFVLIILLQIFIEGRLSSELPLLGLTISLVRLGLTVAAGIQVFEAVAGVMSLNTTVATLAIELIDLSAWVLPRAATLFAIG